MDELPINAFLELVMIRPNVAKWNQTVADLRRLSIESDHPRTRERFLALYMIGSEHSNAAQWAAEIGRTDETVLGWVHTYNADGPEALVYRRTGGRAPLFRQSRSRKSSRR
jgi:hypothetical protein